MGSPSGLVVGRRGSCIIDTALPHRCMVGDPVVSAEVCSGWKSPLSCLPWLFSSLVQNGFFFNNECLQRALALKHILVLPECVLDQFTDEKIRRLSHVLTGCHGGVCWRTSLFPFFLVYRSTNLLRTNNLPRQKACFQAPLSLGFTRQLSSHRKYFVGLKFFFFPFAKFSLYLPPPLTFLLSLFYLVWNIEVMAGGPAATMDHEGTLRMETTGTQGR